MSRRNFNADFKTKVVLEALKEVNTLAEIANKYKIYFKRLANNAFAEGVNLKIQEIKRIARGYRNPHNFILMIYFKLGGLDLKIH